MKSTARDLLILLPVIPLLPVIATWFLRWEDGIPKKVPKAALGPSLLYVAFAAWHFKVDAFVVVLIFFGERLFR